MEGDEGCEVHTGQKGIWEGKGLACSETSLRALSVAWCGRHRREAASSWIAGHRGTGNTEAAEAGGSGLAGPEGTVIASRGARGSVPHLIPGPGAGTTAAPPSLSFTWGQVCCAIEDLGESKKGMPCVSHLVHITSGFCHKISFFFF